VKIRLGNLAAGNGLLDERAGPVEHFAEAAIPMNDDA
jgi:hypothetical protein